MKATLRLIDSVWTAEFEVINKTEKTVRLIKFSRDDSEGYEKERELPQCTIVETEGRIATELLVRDKYMPFGGWVDSSDCDRKYTIINPKHIFSYGA